MSWITFLLPNWNSTAMVGVIIIIFGFFLLWLSKYVGIKVLKRRIQTIGAIIILSGIIYWIGLSFIQDIISNDKILYVALTGVLLSIIAVVLFFPQRKKVKQKR